MEDNMSSTGSKYIVREWQTTMDSEKLTRGFVGISGECLTGDTFWASATPCDSMIWLCDTSSLCDWSARLPEVSTLATRDLVLPRHTRSSIALPHRSSSLIDAVQALRAYSHATIGRLPVINLDLLLALIHGCSGRRHCLACMLTWLIDVCMYVRTSLAAVQLDFCSVLGVLQLIRTIRVLGHHDWYIQRVWFGRLTGVLYAVARTRCPPPLEWHFVCLRYVISGVFVVLAIFIM